MGCDTQFPTPEQMTSYWESMAKAKAKEEREKKAIRAELEPLMISIVEEAQPIKIQEVLRRVVAHVLAHPEEFRKVIAAVKRMQKKGFRGSTSEELILRMARDIPWRIMNLKLYLDNWKLVTANYLSAGAVRRKVGN